MTQPRREEQGARAPRARLQIGPICCERKRTAAPLYGKPPRLRRGGFTEREGFEPSIQVLARITV